MEVKNKARLEWIDYSVLLLYFGFLLGIGLWSSYKSKNGTAHSFFLASRQMNWLMVGGSLFASNIGSGHFIGLAGSGAAIGLAINGFELVAIWAILLLGWVFLPVYLSSGCYTMPEYIRLRFGGKRIRIYLAGLALLMYIFTKISTDIYAGGLFIKVMFGFEGEAGLYLSIIILLVFATVFSACGGLTTVIVLDFWQTALMIGGSLVLTFTAFNAIGGYGELYEKYMHSEPEPFAVLYDRNNHSCSAVKEDAFHLLRSPSSEDLPWTGLIFGTMVQSIWYWNSDQVIVQRALAAKDLSHAKGGCLLAGYLKFLPLFLIVFPGMIARVLYPNEVGCSDPDYCFQVCGSRSGCSNIAYIELVINLLKPGLSGLILSVMMGTLLANLCSIFNSSSTIFAIDIWTRIKRNPSEKELILAGRLSVVLMLFISILWIPILKELNSSQLWIYTQSVSNFLAPPISSCFVLALLYPRTTEQGAFWGLISGFIIGFTRFILEIIYSKPACGSFEDDTRNGILKAFVDFHHLHFGCVLFLFCLSVTIIISLCTKRIPPERLIRLTYATRKNPNIRQHIDDIEMDEETRGFARSPNADKKENVPKFLDKLCKLFGPKGETHIPVEPEKLSPEEEARKAIESLKEVKFWKRFVNGNAVLLVVVAISIWVTWA